jgi:hypothetical protein
MIPFQHRPTLRPAVAPCQAAIGQLVPAQVHARLALHGLLRLWNKQSWWSAVCSRVDLQRQQAAKQWHEQRLVVISDVQQITFQRTIFRLLAMFSCEDQCILEGTTELVGCTSRAASRVRALHECWIAAFLPRRVHPEVYVAAKIAASFV